jgi:hypothetical protein
MSERNDIDQHSDQSDRSHEEARVAFPEYAAAMALGQAPEGTFAHLVAHLRDCPACRAEFEELLALVLPPYQGQIVPADSYPQFDLSFLRVGPAPSPPAPNWQMDGLRRLVIQLSEGLLLSMQAAASAQPTRGPLLYHYVPTPRPPGGLGLAIDIFASERAPDRGDVQLSIDIPTRDPFDQSGTRARLRAGEHEWAGSTNATGIAIFAAVPLDLLARLRVEIELPAEE